MFYYRCRDKKGVGMNLTINNNPVSHTSYKYVVKCKENKNVPYVFNQVRDMITGKGIPAQFVMGKEDKVVLSPETKIVAHSLKKDLKRAGIKISKNEFIA